MKPKTKPMPKIALYFLFCLPLFAYGQDSTENPKDTVGSNRIFVSFAIQNYQNGKNLVATNMSPNPIRPKNTIGFSTGVSFERITRYGLVFSTGLRYERRSHDIDIVYDLTDFDPEAKNNLRGVVLRQNLFVPLSYLSPTASIGYQQRINKKFALTGKIGLAMKYLLNEKYVERGTGYTGYSQSDFSRLSYRYYTDDYSEIREPGYVVYVHPFNHQKYSNYSDFYKKYIVNAQYYLGFEWRLNRGILDNVSFGVEITKALSQNSDQLYGDAMFATEQKTGKSYDYLERNISIGLRLAVGLWP